MRRIFAALMLLALSAVPVAAQTCSANPFTLLNGQTADASQVMANFNNLLTCSNTLLAPIANPTFTGVATIPTATVTGNETVGGTLGVTGVTTFSSSANEAFATIVAAGTTNIGAAAANYLQVTGTTTITAFDTVQAGTQRTLEFAGALILTHNATSLILPGGVNITTAAGHVAVFRSEGSGNWRCISYTPQSAAFKAQTRTVKTSGSGTYTTPTGAIRLYVRMVGGGGGGAGGGAGTDGGAGGNTTFSTFTAGGGGGTSGATGGAGGTASGGSVNLVGATGGTGAEAGGSAFVNSGAGGATPFGGAGGSVTVSLAGVAGATNTGSGGSGGGSSGVGVAAGSGGGAGGYVEAIVNSPAATLSFGVGAGGTAGNAGTGGAGSTGGSGIIIIDEFYF